MFFGIAALLCWSVTVQQAKPCPLHDLSEHSLMALSGSSVVGCSRRLATSPHFFMQARPDQAVTLMARADINRQPIDLCMFFRMKEPGWAEKTYDGHGESGAAE